MPIFITKLSSKECLTHGGITPGVAALLMSVVLTQETKPPSEAHIWDVLAGGSWALAAGAKAYLHRKPVRRGLDRELFPPLFTMKSLQRFSWVPQQRLQLGLC